MALKQAKKMAAAGAVVPAVAVTPTASPVVAVAGPASVGTLVAQAAAHYQAGRSEPARQACLAALALDAQSVDAMNILGALASGVGDLAAAGSWFDKALACVESRPDLWKNRASIHRSCKEFEAAEACLRRTLALAPEDAQAHASLGAALRGLGRYAEAVDALREATRLEPLSAAWENDLGLALLDDAKPDEAQTAFYRALRLDPVMADAQYNLGICLAAQGKIVEAEAAYLRALFWRPTYSDALNNLGNLLRSQGRQAEAGAFFERAVALVPDNALVLSNYGSVLADLGKTDQAEQVLRRAIALAPRQVEAHFRLGLMQQGRKQLDEAEAHYRRALVDGGDHIQARNNLGLVLMSSADRLGEAIECFSQVLEIDPENRVALINKAAVLEMMGRFDEAEVLLAHPCLLDDNNEMLPAAAWNLGLVDLRRGRFAEGWSRYESRVKAGLLGPAGSFDIPFQPWQGEPLEGKRILLVGEQGRGDQMQFIRYAAQLRERGAVAVDVLALPDVSDLLRTVPGVGRVYAGQVELGKADYDYWCLLLSVPYVLGTELSSVPGEVPYLTADAVQVAQWRQRLSALAAGRRKIGVVWAGSPEHTNDRFRSVDLAALMPLFGRDGTCWFSLQKGPAESQLAACAPGSIHALGPQLNSFGDTAAVLENLDLVITVDTAVAHLAGALARPIWVLLPANPDWRWMLEREDSPWYPTMRLFRQQHLGEWGETIDQVNQALLGLDTGEQANG